MEDSYENGDEVQPATILEVIRGEISAEGYEEVILVTPPGRDKDPFLLPCGDEDGFHNGGRGRRRF